MKLVFLTLLLLPPCVLGAKVRRAPGYSELKPPAHAAPATDASKPDAAPPLTPSNSSTSSWSKLLDPASWSSRLSDVYNGVVGAKFWGEARLRKTSIKKFWGETSLGGASPTTHEAPSPSESSAKDDTTLHNKASMFLVGVQDFGTNAYKHMLAMVSTTRPSNVTMLRARPAKASSSQNTENLQPKSSEVVAGTLASTGGHRMTLNKGLVQQGFEDTGFGAKQSLFTWQVIASIILYAFIGANTASFVARAFQWPWLTSMLVNIFIWPVLTIGALLMLIFFRSLAKREAKRYFAASAKNMHSAKALKDQTSTLLAVDEAWCAYHVAHASHDLCIAKINNKQGVDEVVTPESLGKECRISEKRALRWYKWLLGSAPELTKGAVHVKTAELHCADATRICSTLFAIYHEDDIDTLSITDALNVLQGWAAGKYGASHIKSADMDYLINTLLAVLLSKCKCGSVNKTDWMKLADDYPEFFDVEPQYPQHVRYLRLMDRFRAELAQNPAKRGVPKAP